MKNNLQDITEEFNNLDKIKMFEIEVIDKRSQEEDYIIFNIAIEGNKLIAQHVALNEAEEQSNFVAYKSVEIDEGCSLDENLQNLSEECTNAILNSEFYELKED